MISAIVQDPIQRRSNGLVLFQSIECLMEKNMEMQMHIFFYALSNDTRVLFFISVLVEY